MRTYTHGVIGWLLYARSSVYKQKLAALGAMVPDALLAIGFIFYFAGSSAFVEFAHTLFHYSWLHQVTIAMHSFTLVVPLLALVALFYKKVVPFVVGILSHGVIDALTHTAWGYNHFYPFNVPQIPGIVSYTDTWFSVLEHIVVLVFLLIALHKIRTKRRHKIME